MNRFLFCLLVFVSLACAEIYFQEEFGEGWENRWVISQNKVSEGTAGKFEISTGKHFGDEEAAKGLQTGEDARFYQISAEMKEFSNKGKDLVFQFSVKHEQGLDCGGGYFKLLPSGLDQENFQGESTYNLMFGPDICGMTKRTHAIINYKGENHLIKKDVKAPTDQLTHLFTMIVKPDQTFKILIDNEVAREGKITDEWEVLPPTEIKDPSAVKPSDWVNEKMIPDPTAVKPEDYDSIPAEIPDETATKPEDWDDDLDGEWEPPTMANPEYKGEWKAPMIENPEYKGEWVHPMIPNPDYTYDENLYAFESSKYIGLEIWQVKSGSIFDNILVTDSVETAEEFAGKVLAEMELEKKAKEVSDESAKASMDEMGGIDEDFGDMDDMGDYDEDLDLGGMGDMGDFGEEAHDEL